MSADRTHSGRAGAAGADRAAQTESPPPDEPTGVPHASPPSPGGLTVWLTGLPSAGKTTLAHAVAGILASEGIRYQVLDGDVMREYLTVDLGFSREDRDRNVRRIGFVASLLSRHGTVVLCPVISPYRATRAEVRSLHEPSRFVEVHVATPLDVCEERDVKGLYARARRGEITSMTGIDDPYEEPVHPEVTVAAGSVDVDSAARQIWEHISPRLVRQEG